MSALRGKVSINSQPEVLRAAIVAAGLRHGESATLNMRSILAYPMIGQRGVAEIRFCRLDGIDIVSRDGNGNQGEMPHGVHIQGLMIPQPGVFDVDGLEFHSNGMLQIRCTPQTKVRKVENLPVSHSW